MDHYKSVHPLKYYQDYLVHNLRPDGRGIDKFRNVAVNIDSIKTADGSAVARIGNTCVVCGIKAELGPPKMEEPLEGFVLINIELSPLCSSQFRPGPPSDKAQVMTAFINNIFARSAVINIKSLCIEPDKLVWTLYCDIVCLNYDGAVMDACFVSLISALQSVTLPKVEYNNDTSVISVDESVKSPLIVYCNPICTSFAIFDDDTILVDPCGEEESLSSETFSIVIADGNICSIHKPGGNPLSEKQMEKCISEAKEHTVLVNKLIQTALSQK